MGYSVITEGLLRERNEIAGAVNRLRATLDRAVADLAAIERAMKRPSGCELASLSQLPAPLTAEERRAFVLGVLVASPTPLRAAELIEAYRASREAGGMPGRKREWYRHQIKVTLRCLFDRGMVVRSHKGLGALWQVAPPQAMQPRGAVERWGKDDCGVSVTRRTLEHCSR